MVVFALEAGEAPADLQEFPLEDLHWRSVAALNPTGYRLLQLLQKVTNFTFGYRLVSAH